MKSAPIASLLMALALAGCADVAVDSDSQPDATDGSAELDGAVIGTAREQWASSREEFSMDVNLSSAELVGEIRLYNGLLGPFMITSHDDCETNTGVTLNSGAGPTVHRFSCPKVEAGPTTLTIRIASAEAHGEVWVFGTYLEDSP